MIKVSHEMPLCMLQHGDERKLNDYFYALVHLFENHPEYYQYTVDTMKQGREVILDNSAYELHGQPFDAAGFVKWINKLAEDVGYEETKRLLTYIIPDEFDRMDKTYWRAVSFLAENPNLPGRAMVVCQGETLHELTQIFRKYTELPPVQKIGINFMSKGYSTFAKFTKQSTGDDWYDRMIGRRFFVECLYHEGLLGKVPVHLLGASLPGEFKYYTTEHPILSTFIESMDTSAPIIQGMFSEELYGDDTLATTKLPQKLAEHLLDDVSFDQLSRIQHNVNTFRKYNGV